MPVRVPLPSLQMCVRPSIDMPPQTTTKPVVLNNVRSSMTLIQSRSCLSHVLSVKLLTCVKSTGCQWWRCHFWYMAKANPAPRCWAVSTRPSRGMCDPQASWILLLIVWSEIFTPVTCWRSFCRALSSSCSSFHKGANTCPANGLRLFYSSVQLSSSICLSPGVLHALEGVLGDTAKMRREKCQ